MKISFKRISILLLIISALLPNLSNAEIETQACDNGSIVGSSQVSEIPNYDYGPDGLVRFYFKMAARTISYGYSNIISYNTDCEVVATRPSPGVNSGVIPFAYEQTLELRAVEDSLHPGHYYFAYYNELGEYLGNNYQIGGSPGPIVQFSFVSFFGYPGYPGYSVNGFSTPAVPVKVELVEYAKNPILILPGVLGTEFTKNNELLWLDLAKNITDIGDDFMSPLEFNDDLTPVDPEVAYTDIISRKQANLALGRVTVFDYSYKLRDAFDNLTPDHNLNIFTFPYDWRYGVGEVNISALKTKIDEIRQVTGSSRVDVIAHSTGGLILKKYVQENEDHYIGKAVMVGVPNTGAPKAFKALLAGDNFGVVGLAEERMKVLAKNMPVVYDLSPSQKYYDSKGSAIQLVQGAIFRTKKDLNYLESLNYLRNDRRLNSVALDRAQELHTKEFDDFDMQESGVDVYNIVGCKSATIGKIEDYLKSDGSHSSYYIHWVPGDGTVPLESATNLPVSAENRFFALNAEHGKMLSQDGIRQQIVNILTGESLDTDGKITTDIAKCKLKGKAVAVFSPVDLEIFDHMGNRAGVMEDGSIENGIPGASLERMEGRKFLYLPDIDGQDYTIKLKGIGDGVFTLKVSDIDENNVVMTSVFHDLPVTNVLQGNLVFNDEGATLSLDHDGDGVVDEVVISNVKLDKDEDNDVVLPVTNAVLSGSFGEDGSYEGGVEVELKAEDVVVEGFENETSGILKIMYSLDGGGSYRQYEDILTFSADGEHVIHYYSVDRAGNKEEPKTHLFRILKGGEEDGEPDLPPVDSIPEPDAQPQSEVGSGGVGGGTGASGFAAPALEEENQNRVGEASSTPQVLGAVTGLTMEELMRAQAQPQPAPVGKASVKKVLARKKMQAQKLKSIKSIPLPVVELENMAPLGVKADTMASENADVKNNPVPQRTRSAADLLRDVKDFLKLGRVIFNLR